MVKLKKISAEEKGHIFLCNSHNVLFLALYLKSFFNIKLSSYSIENSVANTYHGPILACTRQVVLNEN